MLLGLEDVEQAAACDAADVERATPAGRQAGAAKRRANRGALPALLPRIETRSTSTTRPAAAARRVAPDRRRQERAAGYRAGPVPGAGHDPAKICLPPLRGRRRAGPGAGAADRGGGMPTEATIAQVLVSNMPTICRSTARPRSTPGRASISTARRWRTGWATPPGICARCTNACSISSRSGRSCSPTRRRCRCWTLAAAAPRLASCGPMPPTTVRGADPIRRAWPMSTPRTARPSAPSSISTASRASCRSMAMPATAGWPSAATSALRSAGSMSEQLLQARHGLTSADCQRSVPAHRCAVYDREGHPRPQRRGASPGPAVEKPAADRRIRAVAAHKIRPDQPEGETCRSDQLRAVAMGRASSGSSTMAASNSTTTPWSAPRPITLNRKNALFAGSDGGAEHWATIASLIETSKLNDIYPLSYLTDVLTRTSTVIPTAISTRCCPGPTESKTSEPWPENDAYVQTAEALTVAG